ncbi:sensor histidine kinase [Clostridium kluyveri]|uniref:histidine kinase n=2 Tax=Clostridium kluyveri TaxID=1534 RepID=A5N1Q5_CLOK5|nr:HAMP domain-containing sensor histidine kinase [Clostridium kluyveri]EDK35051.1 Predicted sensory transduction histidine kinase [Clostridium kluyveri DSM 555]
MFYSSSSKGIYISWAVLWIFTFICFCCVTFQITEKWSLRLLLLGFAALFQFIALLAVAALRGKIVYFSESMSVYLDNMIKGSEEVYFNLETETLMAKLQIKLKRLYDIMKNNSNKNISEKMAIQRLVSDISHQVKTPIANIKMYNTILRERSMSWKKQQEFLKSCDIQINKLDFLLQSMVKISRLETGVLQICPKSYPIYNTLAEALGEVLVNAEKKNIHISVQCDSLLVVNHDKKWTSEALYNILDNAVKYTEKGGSIEIKVDKWEFYTKIDIKDTGKGICEKNQGAIFKRFYREPEVHDEEGIGIGLYLSREIITLQKGYIQVKSKPGQGSVFSVFIPNY